MNDLNKTIMTNYSIKTDLLKLKGAFVTNIKGSTMTKKCVCIPIDESGLFLGQKGCYLNLTALEMQNPQYGETHLIKVNFDREKYNNMSIEERSSQPIVGGMKPIERQTEQMQVTTTVEMQTDDEPPF
jgi:hypothetical protein